MSNKRSYILKQTCFNNNLKFAPSLEIPKTWKKFYHFYLNEIKVFSIFEVSIIQTHFLKSWLFPLGASGIVVQAILAKTFFMLWLKKGKIKIYEYFQITCKFKFDWKLYFAVFELAHAICHYQKPQFIRI